MAHISLWFMMMMLIYWEEANIQKLKAVHLILASKEIGQKVNIDKPK
jgi:hypothetical protein